MRRPLSELRDAHAGRDIWLIAGGKSLDYVNVSFFNGKLTVGINQVSTRLACDYLVVRDHNFFADVYADAAATHAKLLATEWGFLGPRERRRNEPPSDGLPADMWVFDVDYPTELGGLDLDAVGTDTMVGGMSTLHTALHVCAYLGAANIILCGADGGTLDGEKYCTGYRDGTAPNVSGFVGWLGSVEAQTKALRQRLRQVYSVNVVSLNPFINFGLEGHRYTHA